jgi:hypothetical protein
MDGHPSFYLASRQDDFDVPAQDNEGWVNFTDIPYVTPANDNGPTRNGLFGRVVAALRRLRALRRFNWPL